MTKMYYLLIIISLFYLAACEPVFRGAPAESPQVQANVSNLELMGLAINANYADQNPPESELNELCVRWVRSIRYQNPFSPHTTNVRWLVVINQETIPWCRNAGIPWGSYVTTYSEKVKEIVQGNSWISAVEIWNEQDLRGNDISNDCRYLYPEEYAQLLKATYTKVKNVRSSVYVVVGGLASGGGAEYIRQMKQTWRNSDDYNIYYDGVGMHPYLAVAGGIGWPHHGVLRDHINTMYAASGKPLWITEFGAAWQHLNGGDPVDGKNQQGAYLAACYQVLRENRDKVAVAFWFAWDDRTVGVNPQECFGLVEMDHVTKRPAWYRYRETACGIAPTNQPNTSAPTIQPTIPPTLSPVVTAPPSITPEPGRGNPRVQYERTYWVIYDDGTLTEAQVRNLAGMAYDDSRRTLGYSFDDAGIGDLNVRNVVVWGYPPNNINIILDWFRQYYGGVTVTFRSIPGEASYNSGPHYTTAPSSGRGKPRLQYFREYWVMDGNTVSRNRYISIAAEAFYNSRQTVGCSFDDAGIGDLDNRKVVVREIGNYTQQSLRDFYNTYYPGVRLEFRQ
jgi:hypothetical protein